MSELQVCCLLSSYFCVYLISNCLPAEILLRTYGLVLVLVSGVWGRECRSLWTGAGQSLTFWSKFMYVYDQDCGCLVCLASFNSYHGCSRAESAVAWLCLNVKSLQVISCLCQAVSVVYPAGYRDSAMHVA